MHKSVKNRKVHVQMYVRPRKVEVHDTKTNNLEQNF